MAISRQRLSQLVSAMLGMLVLAFIWVLFASLRGGHDTSFQHSEYADIIEGETVLRRVEGRRAWVTRLSFSQKNQISTVSEWVSTTAGCKQQTTLCIVDAATQRDGVELRYSAKSPVVLPSGQLWFGGFINPDTGAVYDLLGRAYLFQGTVGTLNTFSLDQP